MKKNWRNEVSKNILLLHYALSFPDVAQRPLRRVVANSVVNDSHKTKPMIKCNPMKQLLDRQNKDARSLYVVKKMAVHLSDHLIVY